MTKASRCPECGAELPEDAPGDFVQVGPDGDVSTGVSIGISSDFLRGRDPYEVYEECVFRKTGQAPIRPLEL